MTAHSVPDLGEPLAPSHPSQDFINALWRRRSTLADQMGEPGPDSDVLERMLTIAARVPDHGRVVPFRFICIAGEQRAHLGARLAELFGQANPDASDDRLNQERARFMRAPVTVCVVAKLNPEHKIPVWEQTLTCGAVCQNLLLAASAHGYAAQWLTQWYAYDADALAAVGLSEGEQAAGFVYIGSTQASPKERARPDMAAIINHLTLD